MMMMDARLPAPKPAVRGEAPRSQAQRGSGMLDDTRMQLLSEPERRAVIAVFDAISSLDLGDIARRSANV